MSKGPIIPMTVTPEVMCEQGVKMTATILVKADWRVMLGVWLIALGCRIAGIEYERESNTQGD